MMIEKICEIDKEDAKKALCIEDYPVEISKEDHPGCDD
jgi:hypothetical protein